MISFYALPKYKKSTGTGRNQLELLFLCSIIFWGKDKKLY